MCGGSTCVGKTLVDAVISARLWVLHMVVVNVACQLTVCWRLTNEQCWKFPFGRANCFFLIFFVKFCIWRPFSLEEKNHSVLDSGKATQGAKLCRFWNSKKNLANVKKNIGLINYSCVRYLNVFLFARRLAWILRFWCSSKGPASTIMSFVASRSNLEPLLSLIWDPTKCKAAHNRKLHCRQSACFIAAHERVRTQILCLECLLF